MAEIVHPIVVGFGDGSGLSDTHPLLMARSWSVTAGAASAQRVVSNRMSCFAALFMAVRTSYWSWFSDRKSVHLVIASEPELLEVLRRLKVRYAALELSQIPTFAARYPGGRLPDVFVPLRADSGLDLAMFRIREPAAGDSAR